MEAQAPANDPEVEAQEQEAEVVAEITEEQKLLDILDRQVKHSGITPGLLEDIERRLKPVFAKTHNPGFAQEMKALMSREGTTEDQVKDLVKSAYDALEQRTLTEMKKSQEEEVAGLERTDRSSRDVQAAVAQVPKGTGGTWRTVTDLIGRKLYVDYQSYKGGSADPEIKKRSGLVRKNVKDGDVHSLSGYLVALEGSKTDEEKFKHLQSGLAKLEPVFKNFGSQFHLDVTRPIRQLLGTVQQVSQRSQQKATHVSPKFTKRFNNLFKDAPDGLETAFLEWWQQYQKVSGFTKKWIQTHEPQRVFKDKYNPHDDVLTVNEALLNSKKFELLETAAGCQCAQHGSASLEKTWCASGCGRFGQRVRRCTGKPGGCSASRCRPAHACFGNSRKHGATTRGCLIGGTTAELGSHAGFGCT